MPSSQNDASALYFRVAMTVEGATMSHVTEFTEIDPSTCRIERVLEYRGNERIDPDEHSLVGWAERTAYGMVNHGLQVLPAEVVPHPSTYDGYADIVVTPLTRTEFEDHWAQRKI